MMVKNNHRRLSRKRHPFPLSLFAGTKIGIQGKFVVLVTAVLAAVVTALSWFFIHHEGSVITDALSKRAEAFVGNLAYNSKYGVLVRDEELLNSLASGIAMEEDVVYAMVLDKDGTILGHSDPSVVGQKMNVPPDLGGAVSHTGLKVPAVKDEGDIIHFVATVEIVKQTHTREDLLLGEIEEPMSGPGGGEGEYIEELGKALVGVSLAGIEQMMARVRAIVMIMGAVIGLASVFAVYLMTRAVVVPVKRLVSATEKIAAGDLSHTVETGGGDEVAELASSFNKMVIDLRSSHEELENYSRHLEEKVLERTADLEEANTTLRETQAQLIQASKMAAMGQFGAGVAHELNQPLAGISGYTDLLLLKMEEDSPQWRYAKKIEDQVTRMTKIINNLRTFARQSKFEYAEVDINQPIDDALMLLGEQLRSHNIKVRRDLTANLPRVYADANQLEQVFLNLISNAKDAMDIQRAGTLTIHSAADPETDFVEVYIADTGIGMDSNVINDIFNPFFTTKDVGKGTGLGLSISLGIIEDHGGKIEVHSSHGKGTVFRVALPKMQALPCWELVDCKNICGIEKTECPAYKNNKGHACWEEIAKRLRRKGDPMPPDCKNCPVYGKKSMKPLNESWNLEGAIVG
ncbi:MAG: ATP-binding protein [bacterium]|jgi:signal transduction histidine kinase